MPTSVDRGMRHISPFPSYAGPAFPLMIDRVAKHPSLPHLPIVQHDSETPHDVGILVHLSDLEAVLALWSCCEVVDVEVQHLSSGLIVELDHCIFEAQVISYLPEHRDVFCCCAVEHFLLRIRACPDEISFFRAGAVKSLCRYVLVEIVPAAPAAGFGAWHALCDSTTEVMIEHAHRGEAILA